MTASRKEEHYCPTHAELRGLAIRHDKTLYGNEGKNGLVGDVKANTMFRKWLIALSLFLGTPVWALTLKVIFFGG